MCIFFFDLSIKFKIPENCYYPGIFYPKFWITRKYWNIFTRLCRVVKKNKDDFLDFFIMLNFPFNQSFKIDFKFYQILGTRRSNMTKLYSSSHRTGGSLFWETFDTLIFTWKVNEIQLVVHKEDHRQPIWLLI